MINVVSVQIKHHECPVVLEHVQESVGPGQADVVPFQVQDLDRRVGAHGVGQLQGPRVGKAVVAAKKRGNISIAYLVIASS